LSRASIRSRFIRIKGRGTKTSYGGRDYFDLNGPHLLQQCLGQQPQGEAACTGYIAGTLDALLATGQFCIQPPVASQQIVLRTVDFLAHSQHEIGGLPGTQQVLLALKAIWPCVGRRPNVTIWMQPNHFKGGIQLW
jgi:hypothetical protein